jgi:uncharacterized DUF497 family protein
MLITFDPAKSERNARERGLPFGRAADFDWSCALLLEDTRHDYGERRIVATGPLDDRIHVLCFVPIPGGIRVISLRKANLREVRNHEKATSADK